MFVNSVNEEYLGSYETVIVTYHVEDKMAHWRHEFVAEIASSTDFSRFPFDRQLLKLQLAVNREFRYGTVSRNPIVNVGPRIPFVLCIIECVVGCQRATGAPYHVVQLPIGSTIRCRVSEQWADCNRSQFRFL